MQKKSKVSILVYVAFIIVFSILPTNKSFSASNPLDAETLYEQLSPSLCMILAIDSSGNEIATGSGFIISNDGHIATNAHVVAGAKSVVVDCNSVQGRASKITSYQENLDLVVLETNIKNIPPLTIANKSKIKPGSVIFALGNPYGLQASITTGLVSGIRFFDETEYIQISADINPGNSGGPVALATGEVVGVATLSLRSAQGINFALPAELITTLPKTDMEFSKLAENKESDARETQVDIQLSSLSFRGIALGSKCSALEKYPIRLEFKGDKFVQKDTIDRSGSSFYLVDILDGTALSEYKCKNGRIYSGSYIDLPQDIHKTLFKALVKKYGDYTSESTHLFLWDFGLGKKIIYFKTNKGTQLLYIDRKLEGFLQKQEDLLLYSRLLEEGAI